MNDNNIEPGDLVRLHQRRRGDYVEGIVTACREDVVDVLVMRCGPRSKFRNLFQRACTRAIQPSTAKGGFVGSVLTISSISSPGR